ncbi:MAG: anti-sigma factor [Bacteroidota bacterium]|nr:anti-sigma factor [Bacteroidota bacterium]
MNTKKYISSGNIENFVVGNATADEAAELERFAKKYNDIDSELASNREIIEKYAHLHALKVPEYVKDKIFSQIRPEADSLIPFQPQINKKTNKTVYLWAAAAVIFLVLSLGVNIILFQNISEKDTQLAELLRQKEVLTQERDINKANWESSRQELGLLKIPGLKNVELRGLEIAPNASAVVYWSKNTKEVYLSLSSLPDPPPGKQYQLWALIGNNPTSAGVIGLDIKFDILTRMQKIEQADSFAISLENYGGSDFPTVEAIYMMGSI